MCTLQVRCSGTSVLEAVSPCGASPTARRLPYWEGAQASPCGERHGEALRLHRERRMLREPAALPPRVATPDSGFCPHPPLFQLITSDRSCEHKGSPGQGAQRSLARVPDLQIMRKPNVILFLFFKCSLFTCLLRERERERERFVVPLSYALIG